MIAAGFGFRTSAQEHSLLNAFERATSGQHVDLLAGPEDKVNGDPFQAFAARLDLPICRIATADLQAQRTATQSQASYTARGTGSVAEAAALAAAGSNARLIGPRVVSTDGQATCALAQGDSA